MRTKLPNRRFSVTTYIVWQTAKGTNQKIIATIGFDEKGGAKEVFCADFKSGSDNQAVIMDACILVSRLLQHGDLPDDLLASMCNPPSLIGVIVNAVLREHRCYVEEAAREEIIDG